MLDVVGHYLDALDDESAEASHAILQAGVDRWGLTFGGRNLCNVLRPQFVRASDDRRIRRAVETVLGALVKVAEAHAHDPNIRADLALTDLELAALDIDAGGNTPVPFARMDAFFEHETGGLRFVEFNGETPAGAAYTDVLAECFDALPPMQAVRQRYTITHAPGRGRVLEGLRRIAAEASVPGPLAVAILDWDDVPTRPEFEIFAHYFRAHGVPAVIGSPEGLAYRSGQLRMDGHAVNVVYKRVLVSELLDRYGLDTDLVRALRDGVAVMANGFACRPLHKKAAFAVLTDERYAELFTPEEQRAIREHVPWTRRLAERETQHRGATIDLLPWVADNQSQLVIKPNDDYGGRGVVLGWEVTAEAWSEALAAGLERPAVVQERVPTAYEPFPLWDGERLVVEPRLVDLDPYCYDGREVHGALTRLSPGALLNVTAGAGSAVPTYVVAD